MTIRHSMGNAMPQQYFIAAHPWAASADGWELYAHRVSKDAAGHRWVNCKLVRVGRHRGPCNLWLAYNLDERRWRNDKAQEQLFIIELKYDPPLKTWAAKCLLDHFSKTRADGTADTGGPEIDSLLQ